MTMLRTFAVALLAASVITAPVFAQGTGAPATPSVKTETKADSATPKVVNANPTLKTAKVKTAKRHYARHHVTHVKHVAQVKRVRHVAKVKHVGHVAHVKRVKPVAHVKVAHATHGTKAHKQVRHVVSKSTIGQNGATAPKAKSSVN
jgi:hypothetical protein